MRKVSLFLVSIMLVFMLGQLTVFAGSLDELQGGQQGTVQSQQPASQPSNSGGGNGLTDYMHNYNQISDENMGKAAAQMSPITNFIGFLAGCILIIAIAGIGFTTACDLLYIAVPVIRPLLNSQPAAQGGMPGAMPGAMPGMTGMGMAPAAGGIGGTLRKIVVISDECRNAVSMAGGDPNAAAPAAGGFGGGFGGPGMGMPGMGMPGMPGAAPQVSKKNVMITYLKSRLLYIIIFAVCVTVLFSSLLMDCGINLGQLLLKLLGRGSEAVSNVNI